MNAESRWIEIRGDDIRRPTGVDLIPAQAARMDHFYALADVGVRHWWVWWALVEEMELGITPLPAEAIDFKSMDQRAEYLDRMAEIDVWLWDAREQVFAATPHPPWVEAPAGWGQDFFK